MDARRDRIRDPREDILLETNFDEDGALTRAYNNNNNNNGHMHQRGGGRRSFYRSDHSIDRFSESSLHGGRRDRGSVLRDKNYRYLFYRKRFFYQMV